MALAPATALVASLSLREETVVWPWRRRNPGGGRGHDAAATSAETSMQVVAEAAAVLEGRSALQGVSSGQPLSVWAWVNALAHRPPDDLAETVEALTARRQGSSGWAQAASEIGRTLSQAAPREVAAVQAELLVPLELQLLAGIPPPEPQPLADAIHRRVAASGPGRSPRPPD